MSNAMFYFQFQDVQPHGTRVIVYNLWLNDDGELELDFEADKQVHMVSACSHVNCKSILFLTA